MPFVSSVRFAMEQQIQIASLGLLFSVGLVLSTKSDLKYNVLQRTGQPSVFTPFSMLQVGAINAQLPSYLPIASFPQSNMHFVPYTTTDTGQLVQGSNAAKKLTVPIAHLTKATNEFTKNNAGFTNVVISQHSPSQIAHHPIVYNFHHEQPLHVVHPTIPVPKVYSKNPPKFIQVLQFPKVVRPLQPIKPANSASPTTFRTPQSSLPVPEAKANREPLFDARYVHPGQKLVSPVMHNLGYNVNQLNFAQPAVNFSEAQKQLNLGSSAPNKINSFEIVYHGWKKEYAQALPSVQHNPSTSVLPVTGETPVSEGGLSMDLPSTTERRNVNVIDKPSTMGPYQEIGHTEIDLSELLDSFSKPEANPNESKSTEIEPAQHIVQNIVPATSSPVQHNNEPLQVPKLTNDESPPEERSTTSTEKTVFRLEKPAVDWDNYPRIQEKDTQVTTFRPFASLAQEDKIRSLLFRNPSYSLFERYSQPKVSEYQSEPKAAMYLWSTSALPTAEVENQHYNFTSLIQHHSQPISKEELSKPVNTEPSERRPISEHDFRLNLSKEYPELNMPTNYPFSVQIVDAGFEEGNSSLGNSQPYGTQTASLYSKQEIDTTAISFNEINQDHELNMTEMIHFKNQSIITENNTATIYNTFQQPHKSESTSNSIQVKTASTETPVTFKSKETKGNSAKHREGELGKKLVKRKIRLVLKRKPEENSAPQIVKRRVYLKVQKLQ